MPLINSPSKQALSLAAFFYLSCVPLLGQFPRPELQLQTGHTRPINALAFSPDGRLVASGSSDHSIKVWNVATGYEQFPLVGHTVEVTVLAFSPDGKRLVSGSGRYNRGGEVIVWDLISRRSLYTVRATDDFRAGVVFNHFRSIAISPDGKYLVSGSEGAVVLWDFATGKKIKELGKFLESVLSLAFNEDGNYLAAGGSWRIGMIRLWDIKTKREISKYLDRKGIKRVLFPPGSTDLVAQTMKGLIYRWTNFRKLSDQPVRTEGILIGEQYGFFSKDNGEREIVDINTREVKGKLGIGFKDLINDENTVFAISRDGSHIAVTSGKEQTIQIIESSTGITKTLSKSVTTPVTSVYITDGIRARDLITSHGDETYFYDRSTGRRLSTIKDPGYRLMARSRSGQLAATVRPFSDIHLWNVETGKSMTLPDSMTDFIGGAAFSPNELLFAAPTSDNKVNVWSVPTRKLLYTLDGGGSCDFSQDGRFLVCGKTLLSGIRMWDMQCKNDCPPIDLANEQGRLSSLVFATERPMFVTGGADGTVKLWDLAAKKPVNIMAAHRSAVTSVAITPNAELVISVGKAGEAIGWITESNSYGLFNDRNDLQATSVATDGDIVVLGCLDGSTRIYGLDNPEREAIRIIDFSSGGNYLAVTPDGLFDGTLGAFELIKWRDRETGTTLPLEAFYSDFFYPALLPDVIRDLDTTWDVLAKQFPKTVILPNKAVAPSDVAIWLRVPGLRWMLTTKRAVIDERNGKPILCLKEKPTAMPLTFNDGPPISLQPGSFRYFQDDRDCPYQKTLDGDPGQYRLPDPNQEKLKLENLMDAWSSFKSDVETLHVVTIAVTEYGETKPQQDRLPNSVRGAQAVVNFFEKQAKRTFSQTRFWPKLWDGAATHDGIRKQLAEVSASVKSSDVVFIFFSGHGSIPSGQEMFYFLPYDFRGDSWSEYRKTGLSTAQIVEAVRDMPARRVVLVIDACQSGGAMDSLLKVANAKAHDTLINVARLAFSQQAASLNVQEAGAGLYIVAAASPLQVALEDSRPTNSMIVSLLLEGLERGSDGPSGSHITMKEVVKYIRTRLANTPSNGTKDVMPLIFSSGLDFPIATRQ